MKKITKAPMKSDRRIIIVNGEISKEKSFLLFPITIMVRLFFMPSIIYNLSLSPHSQRGGKTLGGENTKFFNFSHHNPLWNTQKVSMMLGSYH